MREIAPLVRRPIETSPDQFYPEVGIRSFGRGVFHKEPKTGSELGEKRLFEWRANDLLFNIVFAWEGAVAVATQAEDGKVGSHRFLTCVVDPRLAEARYLFWWFTHDNGRDQLLRASPGGAGRNRTLGVEKLAAIEVPLPPLDEQRRIAQRLDRVAEGVERVRLARSEIIRETQALIRALILGSPKSPHPKVPFRKIARQRPVDVVVEPDGDYQFAGVFSFGRGMFLSERRLGSEFSYARLSRVRKGDFVYPKLMAWEGALAVVPHECDGCFVSPEFPVFELDAGVMDPVVVDAYFRNPSVWPTLSGTSKGTNVRRRRLHPEVLLEHPVPVPPAQTQRVIIDLLYRYDPFSRRDSNDDLDALIPAALHEAFNGRATAA